MEILQNESQTIVGLSEATGTSAAAIEIQLEDARRRLLDLTRRNRLLNHRSSGRTTLRIIDEIPAEVFRQLVVGEQTLQFRAREEAPNESAGLIATEVDRELEPESDMPSQNFTLAPIDERDSSGRHTDKNLQTALNGDQLQGRLLYLARQAASAREEQGCNILYLALGVIEWREKPNDQPSRAPLIFIPADLQRRTVKSRHNLQRFEDDILINPCLVELCRRMFRFELPAVDIDETFDVDIYFAKVAAALSDLPGWRFLPEIHLGLFSFAKLLMYRDLDPTIWSSQHRLADHPIIQRISGFPTPLVNDVYTMPRAESLDEMVPPSDCYQVVDADSSQQVAIQAVKSGFSTVIEGPPGTGKSQTITNIVAECLATGKTVLFVAEKAAALSVVKRRLESVGLGDYVLELHSNKTSKRLVLDELQRTLASYEEPFIVSRLDPGSLEQSRARLNDYAQSLHLPLGALDISPYEAIGRHLDIRNVPEADIVIDTPLTWDAGRLHVAHELIDAFDRWRTRVGNATTHPWCHLTLHHADTLTRQHMRRALETLVESLRQLYTVIQQTATMLEMTTPVTRNAAEVLVERLNILLGMPDLASGTIADSRWETQAEIIEGWIATGLERQQRKLGWTSSFVPEAEEKDWNKILHRRRAHKQSIVYKAMPANLEDTLMRWLSTEWKADAQQIDAHLLPGTKLTAQEQIEHLTALSESAELRSRTLAGMIIHAQLFRSHWQHIDGDWEHLHTVMRTARSVHRLIDSGVFGQQVAERVLEQGERALFAHQRDALGYATTHVEEAFTLWYTAAQTSETVWLDTSWRSSALADLLARHEPLLGAFEQLEDWVQYQEARAQLAAVLPAFLAWTNRMPIDGSIALVNCFDRQFYQLWLDAAIFQRPALAAFRHEEHEALIQRFIRSDEEWIEANRRRVVGMIRSRMPDLGRDSHRQSKIGILKVEIRKKRRNMALRKLFAQTGEALQTLKPCFMMSPISIAQYLAPGAIAFDVVIFDEASQVEPADAYGAIARGSQLILVGDEKQLPPTNFFNKIESDDIRVDDELVATDIESVLSLGIVRLPHKCALRWHYRSRHSSLIEFSNQQFYDGKLRIFPGPYASTSEFGLQFQYVTNGTYMRGAGQHNPNEARAVATAAITHALTTPHLSLGIGAFSVSQQRAIEDEMEYLRRGATDSRIEAFFGGQRHEPFFIKNLETIQGDERDVILLSIGYGPDQHGKLTMNFGPLNREGGWRRLNVLVTRARQCCILFSSIRSEQINLEATRARGVAALKSYLHLAEYGHAPALSKPAETKRHGLASLIGSELRLHGWQVHERVGTTDSFVDLAVVDPGQPERYLAGIETDGDVYRQGATARDRERLRDQVLSQLGWNLHHVWAIDWYQRPHSATQRLLEQLESNKTHVIVPSQRVTQTKSSADAILVVDTSDVDVHRQHLTKKLEPYAVSALRATYSNINIDNMTAPALVDIVMRIVSDESPIHEDELQRVVASHFVTRASKRIQQLCDLIVARMVSSGAVRRQGTFLWTTVMIDPPIRYRGDTCPVTKTELIAPEELQAAVRHVLSEQFGLQPDALIVSTARLLGFRRCGAALESAIGIAVEQLLKAGEAYSDQQHFITLRS